MTLRVKVIARSPKTEIAGRLSDGTLKIKIAAPPERGKANQALIEFLAAHFQVSQSAITILSGHSSPLKLLKISE